MDQFSKNQTTFWGALAASMWFGRAFLNYLAMRRGSNKQGENMSVVQVSINIPAAEKDLIDAAVVAFKDFKSGKGASVISDEIPSIIKIIGEVGELMSELKTKESFAALAYLAEQLLSA